MVRLRNTWRFSFLGMLVATTIGCGSDASSGLVDGGGNTDAPSNGDAAEGVQDAQVGLDASSSTDAQAGLDASSSTDAQVGLDASSATDAQAGLDASSSTDAQAGLDASSSTDAQAGLDASSSIDAQVLDAAVPIDATVLIDAAIPDAASTIGIPCQTGPGRTLWRISWPSSQGGYARVDEWDNGCEFSVGDQACSFSGEPHAYANFGPGIEFNSSSDFFRIRYSVSGLNFSSATIYISMHADGSGGIPRAEMDSPIYGGLSFAPSVPISTHRTYAVDWTNFLSPADSPSLTAVTLRSNPIHLAVSFMELCVE